MHLETIIVAAITGVLASLVTAFVNKSTADKKNAIENITQERKKWRDDLRAAAVEVRRLSQGEDTLKKIPEEKLGKMRIYSLEEAYSYFEIRLNPDDPADNEILSSLKNKDIDLFEKQVAALLKHDWERAKKEASARTYLFVLGKGLALFGFFISMKEWFLNGASFPWTFETIQSISLPLLTLKLIGVVFIILMIERGIDRLFRKLEKGGGLSSIREFCGFCPCCIGVALALVVFVVLVAVKIGGVCFVLSYLFFKILEEICANPHRMVVKK